MEKPDNVPEYAESFRDGVERRLEALEKGADSNDLAGPVRTMGDRMTTLETNISENVSAVLRLTDVVKAQADTIKAQGEAIAALQAKPVNG